MIAFEIYGVKGVYIVAKNLVERSQSKFCSKLSQRSNSDSIAALPEEKPS